jgi:nucleotide-binding universal stress UspA family protein
MKLILVATDGSQGADRAIDYAAKMAKNFDAALLIVNAIGGSGLPGDAMSRLNAAQHVWLDELLSALSADILTKAQARARAAGAAAVILESRAGDIVQTILDLSKERDADVIIVGKRGQGRIAGLLLGSVSQKLVSLATLPVTVVP